MPAKFSFILGCLILILLTACSPSQNQPLPTIAAIAVVDMPAQAQEVVSANGVLPPTFTPIVHTENDEPTSTRPPYEREATKTPLPIASYTPVTHTATPFPTSTVTSTPTPTSTPTNTPVPTLPPILVYRTRTLPTAQPQGGGNNNTGSLRPATRKQFDIFQYVVGRDGHSHNLQSYVDDHEQNETVGTVRYGTQFRFVKNGLFETFWVQNGFIYRGLDTSPGNNRFYTVWQNGNEGAAWCPQFMNVGDVWRGSSPHWVQFYDMRSGQPSSANSGWATNRIKLFAHYDRYEFVNGLVVNDVIELGWTGNEHFLYAKNMGLVGWRRDHDDSFTPTESGVSEIHVPFSRDLDTDAVPSYEEPEL